MKSKIFEKVALFIVTVVAVFGLYIVAVPKTEACSMYDSFGCGSYALSNYGDYFNYWPYPSTTSGCGTCGSYYGGNFGYDYGFQYPTYQYQNYPSYQYVYNQPTYRPQNQYNYVQYPYYQYTYFQNPAPANSADVYNYVQYPYQMYVYNR